MNLNKTIIEQNINDPTYLIRRTNGIVLELAEIVGKDVDSDITEFLNQHAYIKDIRLTAIKQSRKSFDELLYPTDEETRLYEMLWVL